MYTCCGAEEWAVKSDGNGGTTWRRLPTPENDGVTFFLQKKRKKKRENDGVTQWPSMTCP